MKYVTDDLVKMAKDGKFDVIVHGCNCWNTMGAGIAKTIATEWPEASNVDNLTTKGDKTKLGKVSKANVENNNGDPLIIINAYTQYHWKNQCGCMCADYTAIKNCMKVIKKLVSGKHIGIPLIGAGLAGGDWDIIELIIEKELEGEDVTIVKWVGDM